MKIHEGDFEGASPEEIEDFRHTCRLFWIACAEHVLALAPRLEFRNCLYELKQFDEKASNERQLKSFQRSFLKHEDYFFCERYPWDQTSGAWNRPVSVSSCIYHGLVSILEMTLAGRGRCYNHGGIYSFVQAREVMADIAMPDPPNHRVWYGEMARIAEQEWQDDKMHELFKAHRERFPETAVESEAA